ncbi:rod shape-determining protein MreC [Sphingomonas laterariae]|uniref:Cell shape-determining protein MreC n=1 Tax=Edaphosphingomonas laterariae TaxID=861865 RepID=A0A239EVA5_9SPHN|nr:rod shape-determining protein MreC [Sphingomonas laterariae]SNS47832.1 rod shape-determining protein MreC [Sphingomonas laterariae]
MAPPRLRRPGFSRRAQYGLFAAYVVAVAGIVVALLLLAAARFDPQGFAVLRSAATDLTAPITGAARSAVDGVGSAGDGISAYWRAGSQNAELRRELEASRAKLVEARAIDFENRRLKRLLGIVGDGRETVAVVRIVGSTASSSRRLVTLSAGGSSGVKTGQPVRSAEGLIGRVVESGRISARALLITDASSTVPVQIIRSGVAALATGQGNGRIDLRPLIAGASPFRRGDVVMTTGAGGVFPAGIPVAVVTKVSRDGAEAMPLADPAKLDFAVVLKPFQPDLPPPPPANTAP